MVPFVLYALVQYTWKVPVLLYLPGTVGESFMAYTADVHWCVVFTLNRYFYPVTSSISLPTVRRDSSSYTETLRSYFNILWSQTATKRKKKLSRLKGGRRCFSCPPWSGSPCPPRVCRSSDYGRCGVSCVVGDVMCVVGNTRYALETSQLTPSPFPRSSWPWTLALAGHPTMGCVVCGETCAVCGAVFIPHGGGF